MTHHLLVLSCTLLSSYLFWLLAVVTLALHWLAFGHRSSHLCARPWQPSSFSLSSPWLVHHGHHLFDLLLTDDFSDCVGKQPVPTGQAPCVVSIPWANTKIVRSAVIPILSSSVMVTGTSLGLFQSFTRCANLQQMLLQLHAWPDNKTQQDVMSSTHQI